MQKWTPDGIDVRDATEEVDVDTLLGRLAPRYVEARMLGYDLLLVAASRLAAQALVAEDQKAAKAALRRDADAGGPTPDLDGAAVTYEFHLSHPDHEHVLQLQDTEGVIWIRAQTLLENGHVVQTSGRADRTAATNPLFGGGPFQGARLPGLVSIYERIVGPIERMVMADLPRLGLHRRANDATTLHALLTDHHAHVLRQAALLGTRPVRLSPELLLAADRRILHAHFAAVRDAFNTALMLRLGTWLAAFLSAAAMASFAVADIWLAVLAGMVCTTLVQETWEWAFGRAALWRWPLAAGMAAGVAWAVGLEAAAMVGVLGAAAQVYVLGRILADVAHIRGFAFLASGRAEPRPRPVAPLRRTNPP